MSKFRFRNMTALGVVLTWNTGALGAPAWNPAGNVIEWKAGSSVTVDRLDCTKGGITGIVVDGTVTLISPAKSDAAPQLISIICPYILFRTGGQLLIREAIDLKVTSQAAGKVIIINTRGEKGADADPTPELWKVTRQPKADNGPSGGDGRSAETDFKGDWGADAGDRGIDGKHGANGFNGSQGAPGHAGKNSAHIQVRVADFADGATITLHAIGGDGGKGGKGGRGQDGGEGGDGGAGGHGGEGNPVHDGASGGSGGNGGDGGNGGNGGMGGNGGPGGNGADVTLLLREGSQAPEDIDLSADGGYGGRGGEGGDFGVGGKGGHLAHAGCGGSGGHFVWRTGGGSCGTDGVDGKNGSDGQKGPPGVDGTDGSPGNINKVILHYVPVASF